MQRQYLHFERSPPLNKRHLLGPRAANAEMVERQNDDFVGMADERVQKAVDVRRVASGEVGRREGATLRSVRAAVHGAGATWKEKKIRVSDATDERVVIRKLDKIRNNDSRARARDKVSVMS